MKSLKQHLHESFFNERLVINKNFKLESFEDILRSYSWASHLYTINAKDRNAFKDIIDYIKTTGKEISFNKMTAVANEGEYVCGFNEVVENLFLVHRLQRHDTYVNLYDDIRIRHINDVQIRYTEAQQLKNISLFNSHFLEYNGTEVNYFIIDKEIFDSLKKIFNEIHH